MEVLHDVCYIPEMKKFIYGKVEKKCYQENMSPEKVTYFSLIKSRSKHFLLCLLHVKINLQQYQALIQEFVLFLELHLFRYFKEHNV